MPEIAFGQRDRSQNRIIADMKPFICRIIRRFGKHPEREQCEPAVQNSIPLITHASAQHVLPHPFDGFKTAPIALTLAPDDANIQQ